MPHKLADKGYGYGLPMLREIKFSAVSELVHVRDLKNSSIE